MTDTSAGQSSRYQRQRRTIRQSTVIIPATGERISHDFTLRDPELFGESGGTARLNGESTPLLSSDANKASPKSQWQYTYDYLKTPALKAIELLHTDIGRDVFKCSVACFLAATATLSVPVARVLGTHQDVNQLIASMVVWFDPSPSCGGMMLSFLLAWLAFLATIVLAFSSMGTAKFFSVVDLLTVGNVVVLFIFCGGGLGFVGWVRQTYRHNLVNQACSFASTGIATILISEGAVQRGDISHVKIYQLLRMLLMAILISTTVNFLIWPRSARKQLRKKLAATTDAFGDVVTTTAHCFLSGSLEDYNHPAVKNAWRKYRSDFEALPTILSDAKFEHYFLGTKSQYHIEQKLVQALQRLAQDMGGLRSAAAVQFALTDPTLAPKFDFGTVDNSEDTASVATVSNSDIAQTPISRVASTRSVQESAASIFDLFIKHLGPPLKSLVYTLNEILNEVPYSNDPTHVVVNHPKFRSSLASAVSLYGRRRQEAMDQIYQTNKEKVEATATGISNFEEVAASCGQFSSSIENFAEHCMTYLDVLDELELEISERPHGRTWKWLRFWHQEDHTHDENFSTYRERAIFKRLRDSDPQEQNMASSLSENEAKRNFPYVLWPYVRVFQTEDIRFAIKVGGGAILYAMWAYIPATQAMYQRWHLQWALIVYMIVCSMTIGNSNIVTWQRLIGSTLGGAIAIIVWLISGSNPWALGFFEWLVSFACFYYVLAKGKGPFARYTLLTYQLCTLYSYGMSVEHRNTGKQHVSPQIFETVFHRLVAIFLGCIGGLIVTRIIWPGSARRKLKTGISLLWLRMGLMWKHAPLTSLIDPNLTLPSYMDIRTETELRTFVDMLQGLKSKAESEFELRGPFPAKSMEVLLECTSNMLDSFHALGVIVKKQPRATDGEAAILRYTSAEREDLAHRISHLLSVLGASVSTEFPLSDTIPNIQNPRRRLLARLHEFRVKGSKDKESVPDDEDYECIYAYMLTTLQIAREIEVASREVERLYGLISDELLMLQ